MSPTLRTFTLTRLSNGGWLVSEKGVEIAVFTTSLDLRSWLKAELLSWLTVELRQRCDTDDAARRQAQAYQHLFEMTAKVARFPAGARMQPPEDKA